MSDAQPRRRKEKRKKKESSSSAKAEAELIARTLSAGDDSDEGPPATTSKPQAQTPAFTEGDSFIHVHHEGGTGGHWCAKIIFFFLLGVLLTLVGLIIIENRGIQDLDTPVAESRFAQVFDGWVDEGPIHDDHHDESTFELKHPDDEHEDEHSDDEGFHDEIEDIESENEHDDDHDEADDDHEEADDDHDEADDDHDEADDDNEADDVRNEVDDDQDEADDDQNEADDDRDEEDANIGASQEDDDNEYLGNDDDNDDDDDDAETQSRQIDDDEQDTDSREVEDENVSAEVGDGDDDGGDGEDDDNDNDDDEYINIMPPENDDDNASNERRATEVESTEDLNFSAEDDADGLKDLPFEEVDSEEEVVIDNTAGEEEQLAAKKAEKLAKEQEQNNNMGMRIAVGVALVLVTYFVLARKWRNASENDDSEVSEKEIIRRMTLLPEDVQVSEDGNEPENEVEEVVDSPIVTKPVQQAPVKKEPIIHKYVEDDDEIEPPVQSMKTAPITQQVQNVEKSKETKEEVEEDEEEEEEEIEEDEEVVEDDNVVERDDTKITTKKVSDTKVEPDEVDIEYEEEDLEDEEIVEEEEEILDEEEEVEEDISDVDDTELMKKLEAKYGKLPDLEDEPEGHSDDEKPVAPARKRPKPTGGNSIVDEVEDDWNDDPNDDWNRQLDLAQAEMDEGNIDEAFRRFTAMTLTTPSCWRAKLGRAKALDLLAEAKRNNNLLDHAISTYREVLNLTIKNEIFVTVAKRLIDRMRFRGRHMDAVEIHEKLINKLPSEPEYRNQLVITYLMVNKVERARILLEEILEKWPENGVALVHYGFILKTVDNNLEESVKYLQKGIDTGESGTMEGRFLFHLGDSLARLGRRKEANDVYILGAKNKLFLSPQQRSLYNVDRLTGRPWWKSEQTPYTNFIKELEHNWKAIAKEASDIQSHFKSEQENLKDTGHWSQYELFVRGAEIKSHCTKCPTTCRIVKSEPAAHGCRRGQIKFSAMTPGTHVHAHTGPTNCRLRAHLGLTGTKNTFIRVDEETRSWQEGKVFIFDDSFEHEVWHNGSSVRIVLIIDLWHPELTKDERLYLPAI